MIAKFQLQIKCPNCRRYYIVETRDAQCPHCGTRYTLQLHIQLVPKQKTKNVSQKLS
ncbi:hydrogenase maturation nickel metallochaperone HypA [Pyrobaculum sp. 3827-6]|jgi:Zn finger protein HypA/HybF involved in hydrogenase expression|uniref:hydrogenase maturation nickel metallochaperone HypA n=1 Tax=Pyrobaculum sp. 3827-6 TaxID=2983604 RepID=UPI0021DAEF17|nr:hydrogenase maturation nickel metallochaperone HypA [Pyrobaculum sp. 3827-6]MCU7787025.1 hydrogenase maturation nickel metallochaperone HypA [Pyrobaculum sp. 3827-6]